MSRWLFKVMLVVERRQKHYEIELQDFHSWTDMCKLHSSRLFPRAFVSWGVFCQKKSSFFWIGSLKSLTYFWVLNLLLSTMKSPFLIVALNEFSDKFFFSIFYDRHVLTIRWIGLIDLDIHNCTNIDTFSDF